MELIRIDPNDVTELATPIALHGTLRAGETAADDLFEIVVSIAVLIYEIYPIGE